MSKKPFKSIDEQLNILRSRGLKIDDEKAAKDFLLNNNYYRISGYSLTLRRDNKFNATAKMSDLMGIYYFDQSLRHILLLYLEIIEVRMKSIFAYRFCEKYGPLDYLDSNKFSSDTAYSNIKDKCEKQINRCKKNEAFIQHFENRKERIPLWAFVDVMTISDISILYSILKYEVQKIIAKDFGYNYYNGNVHLGNALRAVTVLRNLCAHGERIYNRLFIVKPSLSKKDKTLVRIDNNGDKDLDHLFVYILTIRRLLLDNDFIEMKKEIVNLHTKFPAVNLDKYGFIENWNEKL